MDAMVKFLKDNIPDIAILTLLFVWMGYEMFIVPFLYDTIVSALVGFCLVCLFPWCCKRTESDFLRIRNAALRYSITFMIALLCALKIVEFLRGHLLEVDGIKIVFLGVFLQSAYFLIVKQKYQGRE